MRSLTLKDGLPLPLFVNLSVCLARASKGSFVDESVDVVVAFEVGESLAQLVRFEVRSHMCQLDVRKSRVERCNVHLHKNAK